MKKEVNNNKLLFLADEFTQLTLVAEGVTSIQTSIQTSTNYMLLQEIKWLLYLIAEAIFELSWCGKLLTSIQNGGIFSKFSEMILSLLIFVDCCIVEAVSCLLKVSYAIVSQVHHWISSVFLSTSDWRIADLCFWMDQVFVVLGIYWFPIQICCH